MQKRKKISIGISILFFVTAIIFTYFYINSKKTNEIQYDIYEITQPSDLTFSGKVQSTKKQTVTYNQSLGNIPAINIEDGAEVNAGDVLLTYSSQDNQNTLAEKLKMQSQYTTDITNLEEDLSEAQSRRNTAENKVAEIKENIRTTNKWSDSSSKTNKLSELQTELSEAQQDQQTAESQVESIESSIASYKDMLADVNASIETLENTKETIITADFNGIVKVYENGRADSSSPVVTVYSKELAANMTATEYDIEKLTVGQSVSLSYVNQIKEITGTVSFISTIPESDSNTVTSYGVEISMNESIPLGYSVQVSVAQNQVRIPTNSIITEEEKFYVFKYEDGKAVITEVTITESSNYIIITNGLSIGDKIIGNPEDVTDHMEVSIS